jgi:hypothetical protein
MRASPKKSVFNVWPCYRNDKHPTFLDKTPICDVWCRALWGILDVERDALDQAGDILARVSR